MSEVSTSSPTFQTPPPYSPPTSGAQVNFGFPAGYFVIRSLATGRLLDVELDSVEDGTEIILWPEKESSLVEGNCYHLIYDVLC